MDNLMNHICFYVPVARQRPSLLRLFGPERLDPERLDPEQPDPEQLDLEQLGHGHSLARRRPDQQRPSLQLLFDLQRPDPVPPSPVPLLDPRLGMLALMLLNV